MQEVKREEKQQQFGFREEGRCSSRDVVRGLQKKCSSGARRDGTSARYREKEKNSSEVREEGAATGSQEEHQQEALREGAATEGVEVQKRREAKEVE